MLEETHKCTACSCDFTDDEGGVHGDFGILPMSFCPTCLSCMLDMADQLNPREWVGLTEEDLKPICDEWRIVYGAWMHDFARNIEAKLKEKNT